MVNLCHNRPEGFGPASTLSHPLPTTCFTDTILITLPVYISLALLPALYILTLRWRQPSINPSSSTIHNHPRTCLRTTTTTIYYILIICNILMSTLEIIRLSLLHYSIALLPFIYIGLLLGAALHWTSGLNSRIRNWQGVNAVIWIGGAIMSVIKVTGLVKMGMDGRKGSKYPVSDQVIDVAVMAGVYVVIAGLEGLLGVWRRRREAAFLADENNDTKREESLRSGGSPVVGGEERVNV